MFYELITGENDDHEMKCNNDVMKALEKYRFKLL